MTLSNTPLRILVKSYASGLLTRRQYLEVRKRLLQTLAKQGQLSHEDLERLMKSRVKSESPKTFRKYSASDWIIIALGLLAAASMGFILYN
jgi:hypothetical protein